MRAIAPWLGLALAIAATTMLRSSAAGAAPPIDLPYVGTRHGPERVEEARARVLAELPAAIGRAEEQFGRPLDRQRVVFRLQDIPARRRAQAVPFLRVRAGDPLQLLVFLEPVLRGSFPDPDALRAALTQELVQVLARQQAAPADYRQLPQWFQEGVAVHLSGRLRETVLDEAAGIATDPTALLAGLDGDPGQRPRIAGGFLCSEIEARVGREAFQRFVHGTLESGSVVHGLEAIDLMNAEMSAAERETAWSELWAAARKRARADLAAWSAEGAAAQAGDASDRPGPPDEARYDQIRWLEGAGSVPELREACREYLDLFPDGADNAKVREILEALPEAAGR